MTSGYASKYKSRLLAQGVLSEPARGWVAFEIPGFRGYLELRLEEEWRFVDAHRQQVAEE